MGPKPTFAWRHCRWQHVPEHRFPVSQQPEPHLPPQQRDALPAAAAIAVAAAAAAAVVSCHEAAYEGARETSRVCVMVEKAAAKNKVWQGAGQSTGSSMQSWDSWDTAGKSVHTCEAQLLLQEGLPVGSPQALVHLLESGQAGMHGCAGL